MGVVWLARDQLLSVDVAVKIVDLSRAARPDVVGKRLLREAQVAAGLRHESVVDVSDFGTTPSGDPFIVMEYLQGESLAEWLTRPERLTAVQAVSMMLPIVEGLRVAHAQGVIHRDIKPENILLASRGPTMQPKLLDFGIAKVVSRDEHLTVQGTLLGTPQYMAPEQARGDVNITPAADVWATCVVLYELIARQPPFSGQNCAMILQQILGAVPETLEDVARVDAELSALIDSGLDKKAERRPSVDDLGRGLARWLSVQGVAADASGRAVTASWPDIVLEATPPAGPQPDTLPPADSYATSPAAGSSASHAPSRSTLRLSSASRLPKPARRRPILMVALGGALLCSLVAMAFGVTEAAARGDVAFRVPVAQGEPKAEVATSPTWAAVQRDARTAVKPSSQDQQDAQPVQAESATAPSSPPPPPTPVASEAQSVKPNDRNATPLASEDAPAASGQTSSEPRYFRHFGGAL